MIGTGRFVVFVLVSLVVFVGVLLLVTRCRPSRSWGRVLALAAIVVVGGMAFARWGAITGLPWWIYYSAPALLTFLAPPIVLRMTGRETTLYLLLAVLMAPAIHVFFSLSFGQRSFARRLLMSPICEIGLA